jgi:hypothetical protein
MRVFARGVCRDRLLPWVCQAVGDLPERLCSMSGKTYHVGVTNVEEEDLTPGSSKLLVSIPSYVPTGSPPDKELDFLTKELASWVLVFCLNRLLCRALSSTQWRVLMTGPPGGDLGVC